MLFDQRAQFGFGNGGFGNGGGFGDPFGGGGPDGPVPLPPNSPHNPFIGTVNNPSLLPSFVEQIPFSWLSGENPEVMNRQNAQADLDEFFRTHNPGYQIPGQVPFGSNRDYRINESNKRDPVNYWNYYNNPGSSNSQNRAFYIPDYDKNKAFLHQMAGNWMNRNPNELLPYYQQGADYISGLQNQVAGKGPSVAELQMKRGLDENLAALLASSQSGSAAASNNPALYQREFQNQAGQLNQQTAGQAAQLRAQEQLSAQGLLGNAIAQQNEQALSARSMQNQMVMYYLGQGFDLDSAQAASRQALESLLAGQYQSANLQQNAINAASEAAKKQQENSLIMGGIGAGASLVGTLGAAFG